jgi:hypothetical protein
MPIISVAEERRQYEGEDRLPFLPFAYAIAWAPPSPTADDADEEPLYVWIEWAPSVAERPYPGSALWRAALARVAARVPSAALAVEDALRRFPDLDSWLRWRDHDRRPPTTPPQGRAPASAGISIRWPW